MELDSRLEANRETILARWFDRIIATYPRGSVDFLARQKDRFRNPVGHAIAEAIGPIYDEVVTTMDADRLATALDGILRIRSVQDLTPSEAVGFVFELRTVIREVLDARGREPGESDEPPELTSRIDAVALLAFEKYTRCREELHEVRLNEIRRRSARLMERMGAKPPGSLRAGEAVDEEV
jgi:hypothetical protein